MTTAVATAEGATRSPQLGSFSVVERMNRPGAPTGQVTLRVIGREGTALSAQAGIATCIAARQDDPGRQTVIESAAALSNLRHSALIPVLEAKVSGNVAYWVGPSEVGQSLPFLAPHAAMPASTVVAVATATAAGLQAAHDVGLSHGSLTIGSITSPVPGTYAVAGLGLTGRGPAEDQRGLGEIVIRLLSGRQWHEELAAESVSIEERLKRAQRLREWMSGVTERVVDVVLRATEPNPPDRYERIAEFAEQLAEAVRLSSVDLVHGAFEAISARNVELARLLAAKAALYDPDSDELTLLNLQLQGGSPFGATAAATHVLSPEMAAIQAPLPPLVAPGERRNGLAPELTAGLPPEFLEIIAPQFAVANPKKGMNPIFVLIIGGFGVVFLLLAAALATMILTGS
jgi:hypothetical protein